MSLRYAILGFLNYAPMTGYELKRYLDESVHYFWNARLSQIYPLLAKMKEEGLLRMEIEYQESKPNRKVYYITEKGKRELKEWLRKPMGLPTIKDAFMLKTFFMGELKKEEILAHLKEQKRLHEERLAIYKEQTADVVKQRIKETGLERNGVFWELTLKAGILYEEGYIEWCKRAIEVVEGSIDA